MNTAPPEKLEIRMEIQTNSSLEYSSLYYIPVLNLTKWREQMGLQILYLAILFSCVASAAAAAVEPIADDLHRCERQCGDINVPYPFGLEKPECSKDPTYVLNCNHSSTPPTLYVINDSVPVPVLSISVEEGTANVQLSASGNQCYNESGVAYASALLLNFSQTPFIFSSSSNKFTAIGCDVEAYVSESIKREGFTTGCLSMCSNNNRGYNPSQNATSCSGIGCCQIAIPSDLNTLYLIVLPGNRNSSYRNSTDCFSGFLGLEDTSLTVQRSNVLLDWAIRDKFCGGDSNEYICGRHTNCINSTNGPGYRCLCNEGYQGNPYTSCTDIDECLPANGSKYPCKGTCKNTVGNYTCDCPFGHEGDGKLGCSLKTVSKVFIAIGAVALLATLVVFPYWLHKKKIQEMNHRKNGGLLLEHLSVRSFKETELEKATNSFDAKRLLGEGGNGWVYKGSLEDMTDIAVKKSKVVNQNQIEQFLNEADIVSKINHKNVVKLLGVCLESKVPMLVYDFVPNGTLHHHIHEYSSRILDSWRTCLRIAAETARALEYMHSLALPPIIHRDVKPSNILLDGTYTAKVSDFGASKLILLDRNITSTEGQGTMGYLDPEYLQTGELTTKSDVYGFGVVLMELLSKEKPLSRGKSGEMISLVKVFTLAVENNQLDHVLKVAEVTEHETEQVHIVAKLAVKCVAMASKNRPTMTEVADVLNGLSKEYQSFLVEGSGGDVLVSLLDDQEVVTTSVHFEFE